MSPSTRIADPMADFPTNFFNSAAFGPNASNLGIDFSGYGSSVFKDSVPSYGSQILTPSPTKPGTSFGELALGIGAVAEGIGNVVRGIKGMDPVPPGMATSSFAKYFQEKPDTSLEQLLTKLLTETQSKFRRDEDKKDERLMAIPSTSSQPAA